MIRHFLLKCSVFLSLFLSTIPGRAQEKDGSTCDGNMLIANWAPSSGNTGPHISSINLNYEFEMDSTQITKRYKLKWYLGEYIILNGRRYNKSEIDPALYKNIQISKVSFKAEVWSGGKRVDDIIIEYPSLAPRSGGESGWFVSGSSEWNQVFERANVDQTLKYCREGFEVRNPRLDIIEFSGFDLIQSSLERPGTDTSARSTPTPPPKDSQLKGGGGGTNVEKVKNRKTRSRTYLGQYLRQISVDLRTGRINDYKGNAWHLNIETGLGFVEFPLNANRVELTNANGSGNSFDSTSQRVFGFGTGLTGGVEFWPMFGDNWGIGGSGMVTFSWSPRSTLTSFAEFGVNGFAGARPFHFLFGVGKAFRTVSYEHEEGSIGSTTYKVVSGEDNFEVDRFHVGIRTWIGRKGDHAVDVVINFESPDYAGSTSSVWDISFWNTNSFRTGVFFSLDYTSPGQALYKTDESYKDSGFFFGLHFTKTFDFFGRPYRTKRI